ncbi:hypothetical protein EYF80_036371 [Liparis tanakae]|uniref:Uncharacterized protein n=1 Tax=Liparis tanakae TaxID=230148 RepID=A0A4Z2GKS1_9TELE|nr:hypothetical protein EYF80_036371 [Liparis tanakae]
MSPLHPSRPSLAFQIQKKKKARTCAHLFDLVVLVLSLVSSQPSQTSTPRDAGAPEAERPEETESGENEPPKRTVFVPRALWRNTFSEPEAVAPVTQLTVGENIEKQLRLDRIKLSEEELSVFVERLGPI